MTTDAHSIAVIANLLWDSPSYPIDYTATKTWFGSNGSAQVGDTLANVNNQLQDSSFQFYCDGADASTPGWNPACGTDGKHNARQEFFSGVPTVLICQPFWAKSNGDQALIILHELSHFAGTDDTDEGKGRQGALDMAINDPDAAARSAYNYQYFYGDVRF
jgi:Lysine-specific metallo-endopeptidase